MPYALPPLITMAVSLLLIFLTYNSPRESRQTKLFMLLCFLLFVFHFDNFWSILLTRDVWVLWLARFCHTLFVFIIPVWVHLVHEITQMERASWVTWLFYGMALGIAPFTLSEYYLVGVAEYHYGFLSQSGPALKVFSLIGAIAMIYCLVVIYWRHRKNHQPSFHRKTRAFFLGTLLYGVLLLSNSLPAAGVEMYPLANFGFMPLLLMAFGLLHGELVDALKVALKKGYLGNALSLMVALPFAMTIFSLGVADSLKFANLVEFHQLITSKSLSEMVSVLTCMGLAWFCFRTGIRNLYTMLFGLICLLWGLMGLDMLMSYLLADLEDYLRFSRTMQMFFLFQLPVSLHFVYLSLRRHFDWWLLLIYTFCFLMLPFTLTDFYLSGAMENYLGLLTFKPGPGFELFGLVSLLTLVWGCYLLYSSYRNSQYKDERVRIQLIFWGLILSAILNITGWPGLYNLRFPALVEYTFVPMCIIAYGIFRHDFIQINAFARKRLFRSSVRSTIVVAYLLMIPVLWWIFRTIPLQNAWDRFFPVGVPALVLALVCGFFSYHTLFLGHYRNASMVLSMIGAVLSLQGIVLLLNFLVLQNSLALLLNNSMLLVSHLAIALIPHAAWLSVQIKRNVEEVVFFYGLALVVILINLFIPFIQRVQPNDYGIQLIPSLGMYLSAVAWSLVVVYVVNVLLDLFDDKEAKFDRNRRMEFLLLGGLVAMCWCLDQWGLLMGWDGFRVLNWSVLPASLITLGIVRHNLKEAQEQMRTISAVLGWLVLVVLLAFFLRNVMEGQRDWFYYVLNVSLMLLVYHTLRLGWNMSSELLFSSHRHQLNHCIQRLANRLPQARHFREIVQILADEISQVLHSRAVGMLFLQKDQVSMSGWAMNNQFSPLFEAQKTANSHLLELQWPLDHPLVNLLYENLDLVDIEQVEERFLDLNLDLELGKYVDLRRWVLFLPIFHHQQLSAILLIAERQDHSTYSFQDRKFLRSLAHVLGPDIENAELLHHLETLVDQRTTSLHQTLKSLQAKDAMLQEELDMASAIQRGLLPSTEFGWKDISIYNYYRSMGKVGGDFLEILPFGNERLVIVLADAMGHGIPAAFITMMAKILFHEQARKKSSPRKTFQRINRALHDVIATKEYMTAYYLEIDENYLMTYAAAAHPHCILVRKDESYSRKLKTKGMFLGGLALEFGADLYEQKSEPLLPGDRLFIYTDGLVDCRNEDGVFLEESHWKAFMHQNREVALPVLREKIPQFLRSFLGKQPIEDDYAFVLLEREMPPE